MVTVSNDDDNNEAMKFVSIFNGISRMQRCAILRYLCMYHFDFNIIIIFSITRINQSTIRVNI